MKTISNYKAKFLYKRIFDLLMVILASPFCIAMFIVIVIPIVVEQLLTGDYGPLFISERRISQGREFNLLKINMFKEKARKRYEKDHDFFKTNRSYAFLQKEKGNLRFVGRVMKKYYLDELGQIVNVLFGDMSIAGPRPREVSYSGNKKEVRIALKGGIVGFNANNWKSGGTTFSQYSSDDEYFNCFKSLSPFGVVKMDALIVIDGLWAIVCGKGL